MTNPDDMLRAIIADPANDDLRLVFADLLDDRGEGERSEFIRVQVELARRFPAPVTDHRCVERKSRRLEYTTEGKALVIDLAARGDCKRCDWLWDCEALRRRERELIRGYAWKWLRDELPGYIRADYDRWREEGSVIHSKRADGHSLTFSRGFISSITCTYSDWAQHADAITARCPIEQVVLTTWPQTYGTFHNNVYQLIGVNNSAEVTHEESFLASMQWQDLAAELVKRTWPHITFTLPSEVAV